jgi:hypothetical protein
MNFWQKIKSSIYDAEFYRSIPKESFNQALKYYFLFCLLITFFRMVFLIFPIAATVTAATQYIHEFANKYPSNLTIAIHNGKLNINQPQPYTIPLCDNNGNCEKIIINTHNQNIQNTLKQQNVLMVITKDTAFTKEATGDIKGYPLSQMNDLTINKATVTALVKQLLPWANVATPVIILLAGIAYYIGYLLKMVTLLFLALLIWLFGKKFISGLTYEQSYKISLHAITLAIMTSLFLDVTSWFLHIYSFIFMQTMIGLLVFIFNINTAGRKIAKPHKGK